MSFELRLLVPAAKSVRSMSATTRPRSAASRAIPAPVMPPPTTSRSSRSAGSRASVAARVPVDLGCQVPELEHRGERLAVEPHELAHVAEHREMRLGRLAVQRHGPVTEGLADLEVRLTLVAPRRTATLLAFGETAPGELEGRGLRGARRPRSGSEKHRRGGDHEPRHGHANPG